MDRHLGVETRRSALAIDIILGVECSGVIVGSIMRVALNVVERAFGEEELANVGIYATTVEVPVGGDGSVDVGSNVNVSCTAGIPTRENGRHGDDTIGAGGLKTTVECFSLYKPVCEWCPCWERKLFLNLQ